MGPDPTLLSTPSEVCAADAVRPDGRLALRPGWLVVRRDDRTFQVGLDEPHRVLLADSPPVRRLLGRLTGGGWAPDGDAERGPDVDRALDALREADLLVDPRVARADAARHGAAAPDRAAARVAAAVVLRGPAELQRQARPLLADAGVRILPDSIPGSTGSAGSAGSAWSAGSAGSAGSIGSTGSTGTAWSAAEPPLHLLLHRGEPDRADLAELVRDDVPHLPVVAREAGVEVGPLVVPGLTACVRCVDCHRAERDPRRHLLLEQLSQAVAAGAVQPVDPVLWQLALAWAIRDAARYLEGLVPSTWSASVVVTSHGSPLERHWARHPACGCAWQGFA